MKGYVLDLAYTLNPKKNQHDEAIQQAVGKDADSTGASFDGIRDMQFRFRSKKQADAALARLEKLDLPMVDAGVYEEGVEEKRKKAS
jgi:hypothetical protein